MAGTYKQIQRTNLIISFVAVFICISIILILNNKFSTSIEGNAKLTSVLSAAKKQPFIVQKISKTIIKGDSLQKSELDSLNTLFVNTHQELLNYGSSSSNTQTFDSLFQKINPYFQQLVHINQGRLSSDFNAGSSVTNHLLEAESQYQAIMFEIAEQFEADIAETWENFNRNTTLIIYVIVGFMIFISFVAITFSQKKIDKYAKSLKESREKLEVLNSDLKAKYDKLSFLTNSIRVGVWSRNEITQTESWSPRLYELFGYEPNEIAGTYENFIMRVHPSDIETLKLAANKSLHSEKPSTIEIRVKTKSGSYKWVEATGNVKRDQYGKVKHMIGGIIDIDERKLLENQLKEFVENAPAAIAMFDNSLNYLVASNKWGEDYQLDVDQLIGKNHYEVFPEIGDDWKAIHQKCLQGAVEKNDEDLFIRNNNLKHWMKWEVRPWYRDKDEVGGLIMQTQDITESVLRREELRKAKDEAVRASKAKEQFLATMSHEIRTPLNAINGLTHFLLSENPRPEQQESLELLKFSGDNLLNLVNDILDITKIESGKLKLEYQPFDFYYLVENIKKSLTYKAKEKLVTISTHYDERLPIVFNGDITRITQIIYNLAGNAIKFTEKGNVQIDINYVKHQDEQYTFRVAVIDEGIGISEENKLKVFRSFEQADSGTTRKYGGTGLGLYITKKLLQMMGAQIELESKVGVGSTFYFDLKLEKSSIELKDADRHANELELKGRELNVLVAEDNMANQIVMKKFLSKVGIKHTIVANGSLILDEILDQSYNMIFMDLQMPVLDGYLTTNAIREKSDPYFKQIPIVALSADAFLDIKSKVLKVGMTDYLSKPFKPSELYKILNKYADTLHSVDEEAITYC